MSNTSKSPFRSSNVASGAGGGGAALTKSPGANDEDEIMEDIVQDHEDI